MSSRLERVKDRLKQEAEDTFIKGAAYAANEARERGVSDEAYLKNKRREYSEWENSKMGEQYVTKEVLEDCCEPLMQKLKQGLKMNADFANNARLIKDVSEFDKTWKTGGEG